MKIVETFLCGKENNPATCEDGIFIGPNIIAIVDGVTAKGKRLWEGKTSGAFAKDTLLFFLQKNTLDEKNAVQLFKALDGVLYDSANAREYDILPEDYPRASIIVYNNYFKEIWSYGDCQCRINNKVYKHKKVIDIINEDIRAKVLETYIENGYSIQKLLEDDPGRKAIQDNLMRQFELENKPIKHGYPVLNGQGILPEMICKYQVSAGDIVILATDGYPKLESDLEGCENYLKEVLEKDILCFRENRCTKGLKRGNASFDDRAFCKIIIE